MYGWHAKSSQRLLLAVHGCSLVLRPLPPPTWPGKGAIVCLYKVNKTSLCESEFVLRV